jgi:hypothetical protein
MGVDDGQGRGISGKGVEQQGQSSMLDQVSEVSGVKGVTVIHGLARLDHFPKRGKQRSA